jgi:hypothetical protein
VGSGTYFGSEVRSNMSNRGRGVRKSVDCRQPRLARALVSGGLLLSLGAEAQAQVFQTDAARTALPQPVGAAELGLVRSLGYDTATPSYFDLSGAILDTPLIYGEYYSP